MKIKSKLNISLIQKGKRDSKGTSNNPYIIHLTGTVPNNMVNQTYKVSATAWDDVDHTGTANLEIHVLPQCDKYKNLLQGNTQTIEVKEAIPDIKTFVTAKESNYQIMLSILIKELVSIIPILKSRML